MHPIINTYNGKGITRQTAGLVYALNVDHGAINDAGAPANASSFRYDFADDGTAAGAARWFDLTLVGN